MEKGDSTQERVDTGRLELALRLVASEEFTPEMAINYLFQWRNNHHLLTPLLGRI
jgi:hypothetical protein